MKHRTTAKAKPSQKPAPKPAPDLLEKTTDALSKEASELPPGPLATLLEKVAALAQAAGDSCHTEVGDRDAYAACVVAAAEAARSLVDIDRPIPFDVERTTREHDDAVVKALEADAKVEHLKNEMYNAESYITGARGELDDLWFCLEDLALPKPGFPTASNLEAGRKAAYRLLQSLRAAETCLSERHPTPARAGLPHNAGVKGAA